MAKSETSEPLRTVGGQIVGRDPLTHEYKGASDYCMHCGTEKPGPCPELERLRLERIPDEDVAAFGCEMESIDPSEGSRCDKWCHRDICPYSLHPAGGAHEEA